MGSRRGCHPRKRLYAVIVEVTRRRCRRSAATARCRQDTLDQEPPRPAVTAPRFSVKVVVPPLRRGVKMRSGSPERQQPACLRRATSVSFEVPVIFQFVAKSRLPAQDQCLNQWLFLRCRFWDSTAPVLVGLTTVVLRLGVPWAVEWPTKGHS